MTPVESDVAIKEASEALEEMNLYEVLEGEVKVLDPAEEKTLPISSLAVFAEPEVVKEQLEQPIDEFDFHEDGTFKVSNWAGKRFYSDYIKAGIEYKQKKDPEYKPNPVVMLFESPGSSTTESSFHNASKFRFHDWPPPKQTKSKGIMGPCRYSCMNGGAFPVFLKFGGTPDGLMEHWKEAIPDFSEPSFVPKIDTDENTVYAYLPVEQLKHHVNDPDTHYHLAGKDAIHLMTQKVRSKRKQKKKHPHTNKSKFIVLTMLDILFFCRPPKFCPIPRPSVRVSSRPRIPWEARASLSFKMTKTNKNLNNSSSSPATPITSW